MASTTTSSGDPEPEGPDPDKPDANAEDDQLSLPGRQTFFQRLKELLRRDSGQCLKDEGAIEVAEALVLRILSSGPKEAMVLKECLESEMGEISRVSFFSMMGYLIVSTGEIESFELPRENSANKVPATWYRRTGKGDGDRFNFPPPSIDIGSDKDLVQ